MDSTDFTYFGTRPVPVEGSVREFPLTVSLAARRLDEPAEQIHFAEIAFGYV